MNYVLAGKKYFACGIRMHRETCSMCKYNKNCYHSIQNLLK